MKKRIALLLVTMLILAAAGCQGPSEGTPDRTDLVMAINADISTLHPADHSTTNEMDIGNNIYDGLMKFVKDGSATFEPRVAERVEISEDGLSYTFFLRDDVTFHNGTKLTAKDVAFSLELYQKSPYQGARVAGLSKIEIIDEYTIKLTTESVYSPFLESVVDIHIASKDYYDSVDETTFAQHPIGCGPYEFVSHDVGSKVTLKAYEDYYRGAAKIKDVTMKVIGDDTTVAVSLQTGDIDFATIKPASYDTLKGNDKIKIEEVPQSAFTFVAMNHEKYPYSEVKFRQAIAYAVDRQNMVDLTANGLATVNSNILSPFRFGYSEDQPKYDYNPEKAKQLLTEAGISTPYDLGIMYVAEQYSNEAQVLQSDLSKIGLNVKLEILEFNAYLKKLMSGEYGISVLNMALEGPTQILNLALTADFIGMANNARYSDPEVEQWFKEAVLTVDENERYEIYNKIFTKVQEDAVYVVLYNKELLYAHSANLKCHPFELEGRYYIHEFSW
ncbi:MAG: ABC transporter substrate-binding protein [Eubacteriales bacterium]|nr:ABC transporter substrate-binding protein [Eubacteriales bacterium]MDD4769419.1 ABC transporter substrate-binding protein [Eubacteriales bacterium]